MNAARINKAMKKAIAPLGTNFSSEATSVSFISNYLLQRSKAGQHWLMTSVTENYDPCHIYNQDHSNRPLKSELRYEFEASNSD